MRLIKLHRTPGKKRPPPPPPSLGGRPAIAVSNPSADNVPKAPPPIPSNKPRSNGLTTSQNAPLHTNRSFSATQYPKSAPTSPFRQPSDPVDDFHPYSHSPAPPVPLLPPRTGTASVPVSRAPSPSYPPASFASTSRTSHRSTSSLASAGSADDVPHYRPPPPIPIRTNSIAGKGHPSSDEATYDHASSATRSSRSASEGPLPPFRQSESFPPPPPTRTSSIRPPPSRNIARGEKVAPVKPAVATKSANLDGSESDAGDEDPSSLAKLADSVPDASLASRRPPTFTPDGAHVRFVTTARFTCAVVRRSWLVVGSAHHVRVFDLDLKTTVISVPVSAEATKVTALNFRTSTTDDDNGTIIWAGTKDGNLVEVDLTSGTILSSRSNIHPGAVTRVDRTPQGMVTMGEGGKLAFWVNDPTHGYPLLNFQATESRRLHEDSPFAELIHGNIWTSAGPSSKSELRTPSIRVYNPKAIPSFDCKDFALCPRMSTDLSNSDAPPLALTRHRLGCCTVRRQLCVHGARKSRFGLYGT